LAPSLQEGASQVRAVQTLLAQCAFSWQRSFVSHRSQPPPQSTPLSRQFVRPSSQLGVAHRLSTHAWFQQSSSSSQARPSTHPTQVPPPQSMSVSSSSFTSLEQ